jgi:preprotein translocase subunit YajC
MDNNVVFTNLYEARDHFESDFAKKELGGIMKNIVIKATPGNTEVYDDANIVKILNESIAEVADGAYEHTDHESSFMGGLKSLIHKYTSMEADYRFQKAEAKQLLNNITLSTEDGRDYLFGIFKKNRFTNETIKERYLDDLRHYLSTEAEDIVVSIGKEVGDAISKAQVKNAIISETLKAIGDTKEEITKEITSDDEPEETPEENTGADLDGSEDDFDNDDDAVDNDDVEEDGEKEDDSSALDEGAGEDEEQQQSNESKKFKEYGLSFEDDELLDDGTVFGDKLEGHPEGIVDEDLDLTEVIPEDAMDNGADNVNEVKGLEEELEENVNDKIGEVNLEISEAADDAEPTNESEIAEKFEEENPSDEEEIVPEIVESDGDDADLRANNVEVGSLEEYAFDPEVKSMLDRYELNLASYSTEAAKKGKKIPKPKDVSDSKKKSIIDLLLKQFKTAAKALSELIKAKDQVKEYSKKRNKKGLEDTVGEDLKAIFSSIGFGIGIVGVIEGVCDILVLGILFGSGLAFILGIIILLIGIVLMIPFFIFKKNQSNRRKEIDNILRREIPATIREWESAGSNKSMKESQRTLFGRLFDTANGMIKKLTTAAAEEVKESMSYNDAADFAARVSYRSYGSESYIPYSGESYAFDIEAKRMVEQYELNISKYGTEDKKNAKKIPKVKDLKEDKKKSIIALVLQKFGTVAKAITELTIAKDKLKEYNKKKNKKGSEELSEDVKAIFASIGFSFGLIGVIDGIANIVFGIAIGVGATSLIGLLMLVIGVLFMVPYFIFIKHQADYKKEIDSMLRREIPATIKEYKAAKTKALKDSQRTLFIRQFDTVNKMLKKLTSGYEQEIRNSNHYANAEEFAGEINHRSYGNESYVDKMQFILDNHEYNAMVYSNENIGYTLFPLSPSRIDERKLPSVKALSDIFVRSTEDLNSFLSARFCALHDIAKIEKDSELSEKITKYETIATEALELANIKRNALNNLGLNAYGVVDTTDSFALKLGTKLYKHAEGSLKIANKSKIQSVEDAIDTIFDMKMLKNHYRNHGDIRAYELYKSSENLLWDNVINFPEEDKEKITKVFEISELDIGPDTIVKDEFLTSLQFSIDNQTVKREETGDINDEIFSKAKERIEYFLARPIDSEEEDIIKAICGNRDAVDYMPTTFEKFIIKLSKNNEPGEDYELDGPDTAKESLGPQEILKRAKCLSTIYTFVNKGNVLSDTRLKEFNKYVLGEVV